MATEPAGTDPQHHKLRDGVVTAAVIALSLAQTEPIPTLMTQNLETDRSPTMSEVEHAERLPLTPEEDQGAHWLEIQREKREKEGFDLGYAVRPPDQVEERRRETRPER